VPGHKGHFWAPDILRLRDRYLLYYSVSTWGKNTSAIALATNPTLNPDDARFRWSDEGMVFRSWATNDFNTIDPSVCLDREGRLWLAFGSFWSGIKMVELDPVTGKRCAGAKPIYALANYPQIEAPTLVARQEYYYLFVNWGFCCRGLDSTYSILVGRSRQITGPYLDEEGRDLLDGGGYPFLQSADRFVGPGHAAVFSEGPQSLLSYHFYDGQRRGAPTLAVRQLSWNTNGWPVAGKMISPVVENQ
jgi:arabinan endo-1,5-alpha-L-arabinosidase